MVSLLGMLLLAAPPATLPPDGGAVPFAAPVAPGGSEAPRRFGLDLAPSPPGPGGRAWTLAEVLAVQRTRNPDVREARLRVGEARADLTTAGLRPNPQLQLGVSDVPLGKTVPAGLSVSEAAIPSAGISQEVELAGKRSKRLASAELGVRASEAAAQDVVRTSDFAVESAFYRALAAEQRHRLALENLARYLDTVRLNKARFEAGEESAAELDKIELESSRYREDEAQSGLTSIQARGELFRLLGLRADPRGDRVMGDLAQAPERRSEADLLREAWERRPDLRGLAAAHQKAQADAALARANALPNVTFGLGYSYSPAAVASGALSALALTAAAPLPLFDRNQGEIEKAELEEERTRLALNRTRADVQREVQLALEHLRTAAEVVERLEGGYLTQAERAERTAEKSYLEGATSLLDLLEAQRTLLDTRSRYLDALLERKVGALELEQAVGTESGS